MKCLKCNRRAIIYQKYSNAHLCRQHFGEDLERKVKRDIRKYKMLERGDRVAVALSGGKDSSVLLYLLHKIFQERRDLEILAITIDEGIGGYRDKTLELAVHLTKKLGIPHFIESFQNSFNINLDHLASKDKDKACTYCGVLRRTLLNKTARQLGATRLAVGHNLDDEAQSIFMNYLRGDVGRLLRLSPNGKLPGLILRIKPLRSIPEKEVALYGIVNGLPLNSQECPYASAALRNEARRILNDYEVRHPGTKYSIVRGFDTITSAIKTLPRTSISRCRICGEPTSYKDMLTLGSCEDSSICKACLLLNEPQLS